MELIDLITETLSDLFMVDIFRPEHGQEGSLEMVLRQVVEVDLKLNLTGLEGKKDKEEENEHNRSLLNDTQDVANVFL